MVEYHEAVKQEYRRLKREVKPHKKRGLQWIEFYGYLNLDVQEMLEAKGYRVQEASRSYTISW